MDELNEKKSDVYKIINQPQGHTYTFETYLDFTSNLLALNTTHGPDQSPEKVEFTRLNLHRMKRILKTGRLLNELTEVPVPKPITFTWLVLTEPWCGDAAQLLPYIYLMAKYLGITDFRILLRDENPDIMDLFLTNGTRSIPKLICLDEDGKVMGTWGPRPSSAQTMVREQKKSPEITRHDLQVQLQRWYTLDKGSEVQQELLDFLNHCCLNKA